MRYYIIILAVLSACESQPDCPTVRLPGGGTECVDVAFAELECYYHAEDRHRWASILDEVDYSTARTKGLCSDEIVFDVEPQLRGRLDLAEVREYDRTLAGLGFTRITYCFGGMHCESTTHPQSKLINPKTIIMLDKLGADVSPWLAGGAP